MPHSHRVSMVPHTSKRARVDAPHDEESDAAAVAAAEQDLQCPVCYDLPEGIVNQVRRARLPPCPASLPIYRVRPRRTCRSASTDTSYAPIASWKSRRAATSARCAVSRTVIKRFETFTDRRSSMGRDAFGRES